MAKHIDLLAKLHKAFTKNSKCLIPVKPFLETATGHETINIPVDDFEQFLRDKSAYEKRIGCPLRADLTEKETALLVERVGSTKKADLRAFLVDKCKIKNPETLGWENIFALLHRYSAIAEKPVKPEPAGDDLSIDARAVSVLIENPGLSDIEVSRIVGCSRTTLYKQKNYPKARAMIRLGKKELPHGEKYNGNIDAFEDD